MKNIFWIFACLLASCSLTYNLENLESDIKAESFDDAWRLSASIKYKDDPFNIWQSPAETIRTMSGDCEDIALLFASLIRPLGYSVEIVIIRGQKAGHAIIKTNGKYYEPGIYEETYDYVDAIFSLTYEAALGMAL